MFRLLPTGVEALMFGGELEVLDISRTLLAAASALLTGGMCLVAFQLRRRQSSEAGSRREETHSLRLAFATSIPRLGPLRHAVWLRRVL